MSSHPTLLSPLWEVSFHPSSPPSDRAVDFPCHLFLPSLNPNPLRGQLFLKFTPFWPSCRLLNPLPLPTLQGQLLPKFNPSDRAVDLQHPHFPTNPSPTQTPLWGQLFPMFNPSDRAVDLQHHTIPLSYYALPFTIHKTGGIQIVCPFCAQIGHIVSKL